MTYSIQIRYSSHIVKILNITAYAIDYNYRNTLVRPSYTVPWDIVKAMALTITFSDYMPPFVGGVGKEVFLVMPELVEKQMLTNKGIIHEEIHKLKHNIREQRAYFYTENQHQLIRALKQLPILLTSSKLNPKITITPQALDIYNKNFINMVKHLKFPKN